VSRHPTDHQGPDRGRRDATAAPREPVADPRETAPDRRGTGAEREAPPSAERPSKGPTPASPVDALLTPPDPAGNGPGEPTQGLPVNLTALAGGRYVLGRQLGAGGMGIVRTAHDEVLHRAVAVKLLADNLAADPEARERFLREARAAARIHDPHVVTVYDVGDEAGRPYLVMELVDGPSFADILATEGKLDPHEVVEVAAQALAGIARAHDADLLHRDVKPGNLLRHPDGTVKVTDFGVVEAADAPGLTRTGFVIGTRSYLAPERRRGRPADRRTDLYALGATLVELLTGRSPAEDASAELPEEVPLALARLVGMLLAEDPDDRPATAEEALEVLAGGGASTAEETTRAIDDRATIDAERLAAGTTDEGPRLSGTARPASRDPGDNDTAGRTEVLPVEPEPVEPEPADAEPDGAPILPWRTVLIVGVALLAIAVILQLSTGDGADEGADDTAPGGVERVQDDPETTARNLAEWLRDRADEG
jgi:eukaryotic-like serine/threonine-protein kinase